MLVLQLANRLAVDWSGVQSIAHFAAIGDRAIPETAALPSTTTTIISSVE
jgi:hypothetical protein